MGENTVEHDERESIGEPSHKKSASTFQFTKRPHRWLGGEPRVFTVDTEAEFPKGRDFDGAQLIAVAYEGGGLQPLFNQIAIAAELPSVSHIQVLFEYLGDLSERKPIIVHVRHADRLLADVGPALLHFVSAWEGYARHGNGVHPMYLVLDTGPQAITNAAFSPGGKVERLPEKR